jgi:NAD(P)-dependent dehydrogenase (short-subunit alcohol dehydrogenase family)
VGLAELVEREEQMTAFAKKIAVVTGASRGIGKAIALELAKYGIRVNCIAPGYVHTELIDRLAAEGKLTLKDLEKRTPQRRLGSGTDIAKAVRYVASDDAGFMTGEVLVIDGGWSAFGYY